MRIAVARIISANSTAQSFTSREFDLGLGNGAGFSSKERALLALI